MLTTRLKKLSFRISATKLNMARRTIFKTQIPVGQSLNQEAISSQLRLLYTNNSYMSITSGCFLYFLQEIYHFDGTKSTFVSLVSGLCSGSFNCLFDCICCKDSEHHRNSGCHRNLGNSL